MLFVMLQRDVTGALQFFFNQITFLLREYLWNWQTLLSNTLLYCLIRIYVDRLPPGRHFTDWTLHSSGMLERHQLAFPTATHSDVDGDRMSKEFL